MGAKTFLRSKKIKKEDNFFDMKKMGGVDFFYFKTSTDENPNYKKKILTQKVIALGKCNMLLFVEI